MLSDQGSIDVVVVQNKETQFDAPLYSLIHSNRPFSLFVVYTSASRQLDCLDQEIGLPPQWDHLVSADYPQLNLRRSNPFAISRLALQIRRLRPSLVIICGYYPRSHLVLALILRLLGVRIGLRSDNTLTHTRLDGVAGQLRQLVVGWIQRLFQTWHPVGQQAEAYLRTLSGRDRPCYRFAYAVDNDWFASKSAESRRERAVFLSDQGWPADSFVVLGIMKWNQREDPLTLLQAFAALRQHVSSARLILIGDGPLRQIISDECRRLGSVVLCPGYVPYSHLPVWYGRANLFVHPAPNEPWGCSVLEALACGLPVVAAQGVGSAAEVLTDTTCGMTFPNHSSSDLTSALTHFAQLASNQTAPSCIRLADRWHYRHTIEAFRSAIHG